MRPRRALLLLAVREAAAHSSRRRLLSTPRPPAASLRWQGPFPNVTNPLELVLIRCFDPVLVIKLYIQFAAAASPRVLTEYSDGLCW